MTRDGILRLDRAATTLSVLAACSIWMPIAEAGQEANVFTVTGSWQAAQSAPTPTTGICRQSNSGVFGTNVTVVCSLTGANGFSNPWIRYENNNYGYLYQLSTNGILLGTVDGYFNARNEISWNMINLVDRSYMELKVGW